MAVKIVSEAQTDIESGLILKEEPWVSISFSDVRLEGQQNYAGLLKIVSTDTIYLRSTVKYDGDIEVSCLSFVESGQLIGTKANFHIKNYTDKIDNVFISKDFMENKKDVEFIFFVEDSWSGSETPLVKCESLTAVLFENEWGAMLCYADIGDEILFSTDREHIGDVLSQSVRRRKL